MRKLSQLSMLAVLDVQNNAIASVPPELGNNSSLYYERVQRGVSSPTKKISTVKQVLGNCERLVFASLIGNRLSTYTF